jgi:hypothetical protein
MTDVCAHHQNLEHVLRNIQTALRGTHALVTDVAVLKEKVSRVEAVVEDHHAMGERVSKIETEHAALLSGEILQRLQTLEMGVVTRDDLHEFLKGLWKILVPLLIMLLGSVSSFFVDQWRKGDNAPAAPAAAAAPAPTQPVVVYTYPDPGPTPDVSNAP